MNQKYIHADELFFVVDDRDKPLEPLPRKLVHGHGVWHRCAHIWVINDKGDLLCHQRALTKELDPGLWAASFGGHLAPSESYQQGAQRELQEELGITLDDLRLWKTIQHNDSTGYNNEFQAVFIGTWNGTPADVRFDDGEVQQVAWQPLATVQNVVLTKDVLWYTGGYQLELLKELVRP